MSDVDTRRDELQESIKQQLAELKQLEENAQRQVEQASRQPTPVPIDEATLTPEQRQALDKLREIEDRGREQLNRKFPVAWNPLKDETHPSEIAAALVLRIDPNVGPSPNFGTYSAMIEIRDGQGREWSVWCPKPLSKLWNTLLRLRLQPGDVIALRDNGMRASKWDSARRVHDIDMVRVGDDIGSQDIDYDKLDRALEVPAQQPEAQSGDEEDDIPF
jgi:hypothetical protein